MFNCKCGYFTFAFFFLGLLAFSQELDFIKDNNGVLLLEGGQPRFFYQVLPKSENGKYARANYVHPLFGLDGEVLTEDFPEDHPHHHGIFWSWHQLYAEGERIGDPWFIEGVSWKVEDLKSIIDSKRASLEAEILWVQVSRDKAIIKENLTISFERLEKDVFTLLFDIKLTALVDGVAIGGSEDAKGYGGFSPRFALPDNITFHSTTGKVEPDNFPVNSGPWMELVGSFNPSSTYSSGIVIMGEPDKLPSYQGWILRSANSMQNMAFPGRVPHPIAKGSSLDFRNQILVHRDLSTDEISFHYNSFIRR